MAIQKNIDVVTPDWITDSIKKSIVLHVAEYKPTVKSQSPTVRTTQEGTKQNMPTIITSTGSAFMTPVTPGQPAAIVAQETSTVDAASGTKNKPKEIESKNL